MSRCSWNSDGQQCKFPGVMSHSLSGGGPWRCAWHFSLQGTIDDQLTGSLIVAKSVEWDGTVEQYTEWRKAKYETQRGGCDSPDAGAGKPPVPKAADHRGVRREDLRGEPRDGQEGLIPAGAMLAGMRYQTRESGAQELEPGSLG